MSATLVDLWRWDHARGVYVLLGVCPIAIDLWQGASLGQEIRWAPRPKLTPPPTDPLAPVEPAFFSPICGRFVSVTGDDGRRTRGVEIDFRDLGRLDEIPGFRPQGQGRAA